MKYLVKVLPLASDHITEAFQWYEAQESGLGYDFLAEWESALAFISHFPEGCQRRYKNFRQAKIKRFPYLLVYELNLNKIVIYNVINARRHPSKRFKKK
ncbi:MAG: type II toxin-antitoxin system RelE/ParE family toxin [Bacteroidia bacterium]